MVLAWENLQWGFCDVSCCSLFIAVFVTLVVVLHSLLFDVIPHPSVSYRQSFYTHFILSARFIAEWFTTLSFESPSFTVLARGLQFWCRIFYPWACFTLRFFPTFLPQSAFIKASLGAGSSFLKFSALLILEKQIGPSVCLIHSKPQSWYSEEFVFKSYQILPQTTCGKEFSYLLLIRFELFSVVQSHM